MFNKHLVIQRYLFRDGRVFSFAYITKVNLHGFIIGCKCDGSSKTVKYGRTSSDYR